MADEKLTQLASISLPLTGVELFYVIRPGEPPGNSISFDDLITQIPTQTVAWGTITGLLADQTDLQNNLTFLQSEIDGLAADVSAKVPIGPMVNSGLTVDSGFLSGRSTAGTGVLEPITVGPGLDLSGGILTATAAAPAWGDITGTLSDQTDLQAALNLKAPLASPTFTGVPAAPTAAPGTNTTQLATTAFVLANAGAGTVTSVSSANGDITVATGTTTPVLTLVSAPKLTTARAINGVNFDGTAAITVTAAAGTLTGTTLNATVVTSSLTTVGALASGSLATGFVIGGVTMTLGSDAANDVYYRNGSGVLTRLANGTTGQFLAATTGAAPIWGTPSGAGTVTHTGNLTANALVLGNAAADIIVSTAFVTDGVSVLTVGVAGASTSGAIVIKGKTSGSLRFAVNDSTAQAIIIGLSAQTSGGATLVIPDMAGVGDTFVFTSKAQTLGAKTLVIPLIDSGLTATGSVSNDFSGSSGTFKTSTGATTLGSSATVNGVILAPEIQQNIQTGAYTMVLSDANKQIYTVTAGSQTWTIPANSSVAYPIGTTLTFVTDGGVRIIAITTDTLTWAPTGSTGSRTLAAGGVATALKISSTGWKLTGVGVT